MASLLDTGPKAPRDNGAGSPRGPAPSPVIIALEPSDPSRNGMRRLRRALAKRCGLSDPHLARVRVLGEGDGRVFVAFERAHGGILSEAASRNPLEPVPAARLLDDVAAGSAALDRSGLGAWDLAPERVLVDADGSARLMSVGVPPALLRPTPGNDRGGDPSVKVSSLGSVLYTALTGTTPEAAIGTAGRGGAAFPPRPSRLRPGLSGDVEAVVMRALRSNGAEGFAGARALADAFAVAAGTAPKRERRRVTRRTAGAPRQSSEKRPAAAGRGRASSRRAAWTATLIGLSAAIGIALATSSGPDQAPSSITRAGVTIDLPQGWREGRPDIEGTTLRSPIAATPESETQAGLLVGRLDSPAAAERTIGRTESEGTQVQLGDLYAMRHRGLRPRPRLTGTGYVVPTGEGALLVLCHAAAGARTQLADCEAAVGTLVVRGAEQSGPIAVDAWTDRVAAVVTQLRSSRRDGRRRLAKAARPAGQARIAAAVGWTHERAARAVERIRGVDDKASLDNLSTALSATADAYVGLAGAAKRGDRAAYRDARDAVVKKEKAIRAALNGLDAG